MKIIIEVDGDNNTHLKMDQATDVTGQQGAASAGSAIDAGVAAYTQADASATSHSDETESANSTENMPSISREGISAGAAPQS